MAPPEPYVRWLHTQVALWRQEGIISPQQAEAILARYPVGGPARGRSAAVFTVLGALLLAAGALLFIAANWRHMGPWLKVGLILAATLACHGLGWYLWQGGSASGPYPRVGHALVFLGTLLYGAGIWLIAQIFHLSAHWPAGLLLWSLGALAVAWATGSRLHLALAALTLGAWNLGEQAVFGALNPAFVPLLVLGVGVPAHRVRAPEVVYLGAAGLAAWAAAALARLAMPPNGPWEGGPLVAFAAAAAVAILGLGLLSAGLALDRRPQDAPLATAYRLAGAALSLLGLLAMGFRWEWPAAAGLPAGAWGLLGALAAAAVAAAAAAAKGGTADAAAAWAAGAAALGALVLVALVALPMGPAVRALAANGLMLAWVAGLVALGHAQEDEGLVLAALAAFVLAVIARYVEYAWSLLDRSLFFIIGGLLLLGGGLWLERTRRRWGRASAGPGAGAGPGAAPGAGTGGGA